MSTSDPSTASLSTPKTSQIDSRPYRQVGWGFWLKWMLATTLGWLIGMLILGVEPIRITIEVITYITIAGAFASMFGAIVAASFGLMQGIVLKSCGFSAWAWIAASCIGGIVGGIVSDAAFFLIYRLTNLLPVVSFSSPFIGILLMAVAGATTGGVVGYFQGNLLQKRGLSKSYWIRICATGWAIGCMLGEVVGQSVLGTMMWPLAAIDAASDKIILAIFAMISGLIGGAITGYPLMRALQQSSIQNLKAEI